MRQIPTREFPTKFPGWDLSRFAKFGTIQAIVLLALYNESMTNNASAIIEIILQLLGTTVEVF